MPHTANPISFTNAAGDALSARLHEPAGVRRGVALFAHCFTCSKDLRAARRIAESLATAGIATLRFDFTGLGQSEGEFADTHFSSNVEDLIAAAAWLREHVEAPSILVGHSLGGAAVLSAASRVPECRAVATIGSPSDPAHIEHLLGPVTAELEARGEAEVQLAGRSFRVRQALLDDIRAQRLLHELPALGRATLFLHSPQDNTVGVEHARALFEAARHPKSFISLDGADHLLSRPADADYVGGLVATWALRYLPPVAAHPVAKHEDDVEAHTEQGTFGTDVVVNGLHRLRADEPTSVGGQDTGPSPYDLLSAALAACTTMTLQMYAARKEWPLRRAIAHVRHRKVHASDCDTCETTSGRVDHFERVLELEGPLSDEQRARLLEIANRCPVHRTLHAEVKVSTRAATAGGRVGTKSSRPDS